MRTRVFLVLVAIAVGGAGAGIYLASTPRTTQVSKEDLQTVRDELAGTPTPAEAPQASELEAELETLQAEVAERAGSKGEAPKTDRRS